MAPKIKPLEKLINAGIVEDGEVLRYLKVRTARSSS